MWEKFKRKLHNKIEKNVVKIPSISWTKTNGKVVKEENVLLKRSKLPLIGDWARIYPPVIETDEIDEKTGENKLEFKLLNFIFGGYKNAIKFALIMFILYMIYYWVTGILGINAEYFNGQDYVIIGKEAFNKFCQTSIYSESNYSQIGNLNLSVFK